MDGDPRNYGIWSSKIPRKTTQTEKHRTRSSEVLIFGAILGWFKPASSLSGCIEHQTKFYRVWESLDCWFSFPIPNIYAFQGCVGPHRYVATLVDPTSLSIVKVVTYRCVVHQEDLSDVILFFHIQTNPFQWIGLRENRHRKPSIFPWNMGPSCIFSQQNQSIEREVP